MTTFSVVDQLTKSILENHQRKTDYASRGKTLQFSDISTIYVKDKGLFLEKFGRYMTQSQFSIFIPFKGNPALLLEALVDMLMHIYPYMYRLT